MADELEKKLATDQWLGGQLPTSADKDAFEGLAVPNPATHPNTFAWWCLVAKFTAPVRAAWTAAAAAPAKGGKTAAPAKAPATPAVQVPATPAVQVPASPAVQVPASPAAVQVSREARAHVLTDGIQTTAFKSMA